METTASDRFALAVRTGTVADLRAGDIINPGPCSDVQVERVQAVRSGSIRVHGLIPGPYARSSWDEQPISYRRSCRRPFIHPRDSAWCPHPSYVCALDGGHDGFHDDGWGHR